MRLASLFGPDLHRLLETEPEAIREALEELHEEDIAEICEELSEDDVVRLLDVLPNDFASGVLERLPDELRTTVLERVEAQKAAELLAGMSRDEAADAVQTLDRPLRHSILEELVRFSPEAADDVKELAAYPENTAGSIMTTAFVSVVPEAKVWQAMAEVRRRSKNDSAETITYVYALAHDEQLVGVVSLRELILAEPGELVSDVMNSKVVRVLDHADREEVARTMAKYDFHALPVVDDHSKMMGVITSDDVVDVIIEEATEDAHKMGAVSPMEGGYLHTGLIPYWRGRVTWLVVLFLGGFLTANVMQGFSADLERVIAVAIFIPLIISTGGNAGSQSATLVIRALAMAEVKPSDWAQIARRELVVGVALGLVVGILGFARAFFVGDAVDAVMLGLTVSISILAVVTIGSLLGSLLPLLIQRVGLDPAVSSTPFIASLSDVMGLLVYLGIARALLS